MSHRRVGWPEPSEEAMTIDLSPPPVTTGDHAMMGDGGGGGWPPQRRRAPPAAPQPPQHSLQFLSASTEEAADTASLATAAISPPPPDLTSQRALDGLFDAPGNAKLDDDDQLIAASSIPETATGRRRSSGRGRGDDDDDNARRHSHHDDVTPADTVSRQQREAQMDERARKLDAQERRLVRWARELRSYERLLAEKEASLWRAEERLAAEAVLHTAALQRKHQQLADRQQQRSAETAAPATGKPGPARPLTSTTDSMASVGSAAAGRGVRFDERGARRAFSPAVGQRSGSGGGGGGASQRDFEWDDRVAAASRFNADRDDAMSLPESEASSAQGGTRRYNGHDGGRRRSSASNYDD